MKETQEIQDSTEIQSHILNSIYDKLKADMDKSYSKIFSLGRVANRIEIYFSPIRLYQTITLEKNSTHDKLSNNGMLEILIDNNGKIHFRSLEFSQKKGNSTGQVFEKMSQYIVHVCDLSEDQLEFEEWMPSSLIDASSLTFFKANLEDEEKESEHITLIKNKNPLQRKCCSIV